ncbi:hypothetical protein SARC_01248 [Sphaeroforma arctica JP610]|uniref:AB hydrolase-1 domain-containing protein n=1 Tax=Sphaeroforma arctica JP610 TaxID=667725 RepID=A0A0L0GCJ3_9EUKA|nr:hypothetical protein SARC_01248 [Sphaeroforma arctica JP610]KNC86619.1 hypothetical protein SARC_01248 [Sphaeroforma arctica JP610]|eukprot:XP_014160521.1 hypothetical protein SARC_01248 [Sphaeroforma arctica JP610]
MAHYEYADGSASAVAKYVRPLIKAGFNVLMWDKRNHGLSQHMPPIALGLYEQSDVKAMINWLVETHPLACTDGQVAILGEGVGAAEAMYAAATDDRIAAVVSDSSYLTGALSMKEWVYSHWYLIYVPLTWISHWQWCLELVAGWSFSDMDVAAVMGASHTPVLIAHGTRDEWHQFADGKLLYEYVLGNRTEQGAPTEWFPYAQAHTQGYLEPNYFERVIEFLDVHFKISVSPPVAINEAVTKKRTKPQNAADSKGEKENPDSKNRPPHQPEVEDSTEQQPPTPTTQASPKETLDSKNRPPPPPAVEDRTEQHPSTPTTQASTTEPVKPDTEAHAQSGADAESKDKPAPKPEPEDR